MNPSYENKPLVLKEDLFVVSQRGITPHIFRMALSRGMALDMVPGQFLHLRVSSPGKLLRRPISICQTDKVNKVATIVYRVERAGTAILSQIKADDRVDIIGPQGNGFGLLVVTSGQKVLLIGGGIGVPPLIETAKQLAVKGVDVTSVLGFTNKEAAILEGELSAYGKVYVTTSDGSYGIRGHVSTVINDLMQNETYDVIRSYGAPNMLKYIDQEFENHPHAYLPMELRMACGMGACCTCVVHLKSAQEATNRRVYENGSVFKTGKIIL